MDRIDSYRLFVRVVETGSFSRAARDLQVTQPTVTRQVAALEERLGVRLFNRNTRRLSLTDDGRLCYARAQQLLETFDETETVARSARAELRGRIRLATRRLSEGAHAGGVAFRVLDNGPGITAEAQDSIWDPFFTTKTRGTGLGLAVVRRIVEAHGGSVQVCSRPGEGACFEVHLGPPAAVS